MHVHWLYVNGNHHHHHRHLYLIVQFRGRFSPPPSFSSLNKHNENTGGGRKDSGMVVVVLSAKLPIWLFGLLGSNGTILWLVHSSVICLPSHHNNTSPLPPPYKTSSTSNLSNPNTLIYYMLATTTTTTTTTTVASAPQNGWQLLVLDV